MSIDDQVISRTRNYDLYMIFDIAPIHKIWSRISLKQLGIEARFQWTSNRKWHYGESNGHVIYDVT